MLGTYAGHAVPRLDAELAESFGRARHKIPQRRSRERRGPPSLRLGPQHHALRTFSERVLRVVQPCLGEPLGTGHLASARTAPGRPWSMTPK